MAHDHILGTIPASFRANRPDRLYLAAVPIPDADGTCHRISITRPDGKHLTAADLNSIRRAFGQEPLTAVELDSYGIRDWGTA